MTRFIGIIIFLYILTLVDFNELRNVWQNHISLKYLLKSLFLIPLVILIKSYRWSLILGSQSIKLNIINAYSIYFSSLFYGSISPGGVLGEITKVLHLKNEIDLSPEKTTPSVILDRVFDLFIILCIGVFCLSYFIMKNYFFSLFILILGFIIPFYLAFIFLIKYLKKIINKNIIFKTIFSVTALLNELKFSIFLKAVIMTIIGQAIACIQVIYIFKILNLDFTISYVLAINSSIVLISILPITIAGIGSRDSIVLYLFSLNNVKIEYAILFSSLYLFIFNFGTYFFSFISLLFKPLRIK
ncbi:flippase-like domain-containing protein [Candidatus Marinimicrobia bacterium]|nr:flippase-like domain-containing protein [Candidatus Neomarinimicrobiota bacterium]